ncbi:MAG: flippase-like domain-containing protein [Chloroflexi bacterium]|nr:flippase-like domain-containing protein [Chloroflexota bacterium]
MSRWAKVLGFGLTLVFLVLALRNVDLAEVWRAIVSADFRWLLPAALFVSGGYLVRTLRWQSILRSVLPADYGTLFSCLMLGFAANNVLPARVGEVVRAYTLRQKTGGSATLGLATVVVERVFDGVTLLALMALALQVAAIPTDDERLRLVEVASIAVFTTALVVLVALLVLRERALAVVAWLVRPLPAAVAARARRMAGSFIVGLDCLRRPSALLRIVPLSVLVWVCEAASYGCVAKAFSIDLAPSQFVSAILFLTVFVNLGIMVPSAPGFIGTFQFFARLALAPFGVAPDVAFGLAIVAHALQYGLVTGTGLVIMWRDQVSLASLARAPADPSAT